MRIGLSQRRTAAYLHLWAALLSAYAILLRFVPPRPHGAGTCGTRCIAARVGLFVLAASVWMVYTLEILKQRHLEALRLRSRSRKRPRGSGRARPHGPGRLSARLEARAAGRSRSGRSRGARGLRHASAVARLLGSI